MSKSQFANNEEEIMKYWQDKKIFEQTSRKASPQGEFVFYEGPPTANGKPGLHHVLARVFKDVMPRYKIMCGYHVERKAGWDTHGLPVELQVEKELGISGKPEIEKYGIAEFNQKCKESVWKFKDEFEKLTERIGFWLDMEKPYVTYTNEYIESVWAVIKEIANRGLIYKGYKVVPQCPSCGTALSSHEVAQGYKNVEETSIYIKFKVKNQPDTYILSWTTTPWTLPGNVALAVGAQLIYVKVKAGEQHYILAESLVESVLGHDVEIEQTMTGADLAGLEYEPLFPGAIDPGNQKAWYAGLADFVTIEDGTGIVHTAAMYGEDDYQFGLKNRLPLCHTVNEDGTFMPSVKQWAGRFVKDLAVEREIIQDLNDRGLLLKEKKYQHDYPFCWRCGSPLLYYAKNSWFIKMADLRDKLIENNQQITWVPEYIKNGRFGEWLENIKDWAISRQRYWGTPMPIWECDKCQAFDVLGSLAEIQEKTGRQPADPSGAVDAHRPFIDDLSYQCDCGGRKKRVADVLDVWLDSGTMPFSQHHYPFENQELIDSGQQYPADYISEAIDQTRGWFYTLLAIATALDRGAPYKNVICLGHIRDAHGKKMSKSKGNVVDPWQVIDKYGADALRLHLFTINHPGDSKNFDEKNVQDVLRQVIMLWGNVVNFFEMYSQDRRQKVDMKNGLANVLDQWIAAELQILIKEITEDLEAYHIFEAARRLAAFIDELSTWYVRRSRDRFKTPGPDQEQAIQTLQHVLITLNKLMAPFTPFTAERFYLRLDNSLDSVHLEDWPVAQPELIDQNVLAAMKQVRQIVELGLAARDQAQIKVRQPLAELLYQGQKLEPMYEQIAADEINVKKVEFAAQVEARPGLIMKETAGLKINLNIELTPELKQQGHWRELVRQINSMRKKAGLTINDRVVLHWQSDSSELQAVLADPGLAAELAQSTILSAINNEKIELPPEFSQLVKINQQSIWLGLEKEG